MLLFHGTSGDRSLIDAILAEGLRPHGGRAWAEHYTGVDAHVFACTSPIGSAGGDPVWFARRGAGRGRDAWMIVLDLAAAQHELIVGAVANSTLERYWQTAEFAGAVLGQQLVDAVAVIELARARGVGCADLLVPRVVSCLPGLTDGAPDADTLLGFAAAYLRARPGEKRRVAASFGVRVPDWFADDGHYPWCAGCMCQLFEVRFAVPGLATGAHGEVHRRAGTHDVLFSPGSFTRVDRATLGAMLDTLGRWFAAHPPAAITAALRRPRWTLAELQRTLPPPREQVPSTWWPDFLTADRAARLAAPDVQAMLSAAPPAVLLGAIRLGDGHRFAASVRPGSGETLAANLWARAAELRALRAEAGRPIVLT